MARKTIPLSDTQIKAAKPKDKEYTLQDGLGLYLLIKPTGLKVWRFNYYRPFIKKRVLISFGSYPEITLQQARKKRDEARELLQQDIDPQEHYSVKKQNILKERTNTFKKVADNWLVVEKSKNYKEDTIKKMWQSLENHIFPYLGDVPMTSIDAGLLINVLDPLRSARKLDMLKRVIRRVNKIMDYAVNTGIIQFNPVTKVSAAFENPTVQNMPTIKPLELPEFMHTLSLARIELQTRCLVEWQLLTITRPKEAVSVQWNEIDLDSRTWTIPAEIMKMKREHIIPLSPQAIKILEIIKPFTGHRSYVFPSMKAPYNKPMSSQTVNMVIKRMGYAGRLVSHGLRSLASTTLNEEGFSADIIESALAHADKNEVRRIYNRATYLEQRRIMMTWWGDFVEQASKGNVSLSGKQGLKIVNN